MGKDAKKNLVITFHGEDKVFYETGERARCYLSKVINRERGERRGREGNKKGLTPRAQHNGGAVAIIATFLGSLSSPRSLGWEDTEGERERNPSWGSSTSQPQCKRATEREPIAAHKLVKRLQTEEG